MGKIAQIFMAFSEKLNFNIFFKNLKFSKRQNHKEDGANFCRLLRKAELYLSLVTQPMLQR